MFPVPWLSDAQPHVAVIGSWDPKSTTVGFSVASRTSYTQLQKKTALSIHLPSSRDSTADWCYVKYAADNRSAQMSGACSKWRLKSVHMYLLHAAESFLSS